MHALQIAQNVIVPEAQDRVALRVEVGRAAFILRIAVMLTTVEFDHQGRLAARKVGNEWANGELSDELVAVQLAVPHQAPEALFGIGAFAAQRA
jgi:hypothetical protein